MITNVVGYSHKSDVVNKYLFMPLKYFSFRVSEGPERLETGAVEFVLNTAKSSLDPFTWANKASPEFDRKMRDAYGFFTDLSGVSDEDLEVLWAEYVYGKCSSYLQVGAVTRMVKKKYNQTVVTNAWLKAFEMYNRHIKKPLRRAFFNAEFPGNFILAWQYYNKIRFGGAKFEWHGNSYVPDETNMALEDVYGMYKNNRKNWVMDRLGIDGDVTKLENIRKIVGAVGSWSVDLFTSDGGIGSSPDDFNSQESVQIALKYGETYIGAQTVSHKGTMIVKMFTLFTEEMQYLIQFLHDNFESVLIEKPYTSKPANSEIYLVASGRRHELLKGADVVEQVLRGEAVDFADKIRVDVFEAVRQIHGNYQVEHIKRNRELYLNFKKTVDLRISRPLERNFEKYNAFLNSSLKAVYGNVHRHRENFFAEYESLYKLEHV